MYKFRSVKKCIERKREGIFVKIEKAGREGLKKVECERSALNMRYMIIQYN